MGCYLKRPQLRFVYSRFFADTLFQWAATSNALSYSICKLPKEESAKSFNGLLPQTPSATISVGFGLEHYLHRFNGLLPQTPSATGNAGWWQLELVWFQWAATSNALSYLHLTKQTETKSQFQWAATSNALSYSINQLTDRKFDYSFNGLLPQTPSATKTVDASWRPLTLFQWAATSNALSYENRPGLGEMKRKKFQWAATSNALSYSSHCSCPSARISEKFQWAATSNALSYSRPCKYHNYRYLQSDFCTSPFFAAIGGNLGH